ncbi:MAG TPA: flippase [Bacilli bacterium]
MTRYAMLAGKIVNLKFPSLVLFTAMVTSRGLEFILKSILSRMLGPEQFGIIQQYETYFEIFVVLSAFGISTAILKFVSEKNSEEERKKTFTFLVKTNLAVSSVICLVIYILVNSLPFIREHQVIVFLNATVMLLPIIALTHSSHGLFIHFLNGINKINYVAVIKVGFFLAQFLIILPAVYLFGAKVYAEAYFILCLASFLLCFPLVKKHWQRRAAGYLRSLKESENVRMYSFIGYSAISNLTSILLGYVDLLVVMSFFSNGTVGAYSVASMIAKGLWMLPLSIMQVELPKISKGHSDKNLDVYRYYKKLQKKMIVVCWPVVFAVYMISGYIIRFIFGVDYLAILPVLKILLLATLVYALTLVGGNIFIATNYPKINLLLNLLRAFISVVLSVLLIPEFGIKGVAVSSVVTFVIFYFVQGMICKGLFYEGQYKERTKEKARSVS